MTCTGLFSNRLEKIGKFYVCFCLMNIFYVNKLAKKIQLSLLGGMSKIEEYWSHLLFLYQLASGLTLTNETRQHECCLFRLVLCVCSTEDKSAWCLFACLKKYMIRGKGVRSIIPSRTYKKEI